MDWLHAIVLALVQGITEFLPVSSSAHLILVPALFGWTDQGLAFDVTVHIGTLFAVVWFLRKELTLIAPAWITGWRTRQWNNHGQLGWMVIIATLPVALLGLLAGGLIETHLRAVSVIGVTTLCFGLLLGWADRKGESQTTTLSQLTWQHVLWVGCAQALALIPGTSRSGITITAMLALGYSRVSATKFSFLLAVPAISLSGLHKGRELALNHATVDWSSFIIGVVVSALMAFYCMQWFMHFVQKVGMRPFVIYRVILALIIFAVAM